MPRLPDTSSAVTLSSTLDGRQRRKEEHRQIDNDEEGGRLIDRPDVPDGEDQAPDRRPGEGGKSARGSPRGPGSGVAMPGGQHRAGWRRRRRRQPPPWRYRWSGGCGTTPSSELRAMPGTSTRPSSRSGPRGRRRESTGRRGRRPSARLRSAATAAAGQVPCRTALLRHLLEDHQHQSPDEEAGQEEGRAGSSRPANCV